MESERLRIRDIEQCASNIEKQNDCPKVEATTRLKCCVTFSSQVWAKPNISWTPHAWNLMEKPSWRGQESKKIRGHSTDLSHVHTEYSMPLWLLQSRLTRDSHHQWSFIMQRLAEPRGACTCPFKCTHSDVASCKGRALSPLKDASVYLDYTLLVRELLRELRSYMGRPDEGTLPAPSKRKKVQCSRNFSCFWFSNAIRYVVRQLRSTF